MSDWNIPDYLKSSLDAWANTGRPTGGFLQAVLCNDLMTAVGRADPTSFSCLKEICLYVYNELPSPCWGSAEKLQAWYDKHAAARKAAEVQP